MAANPESLRAKLLTVSKEKKLVFQDLLNRYGAEQFLARLSASRFADRFVFKGGSLLTYLIETDRRTKDLDFSVSRLSQDLGKSLDVIRHILDIQLEDGLTWLSPTGSPLNHPEMDYPGLRIKCPFRLGTARGLVRMDLAVGDIVEPKKIKLQRIRYRGKLLIGPDFPILAYPAETIFAEKLQIAVKRGGRNTRMKDYYDLHNLIRSKTLDPPLLRRSIEKTFQKRGTPAIVVLDLDDDAMKRLQTYWAAYVRKMKVADAPDELADVVREVNRILRALR